ncbi:hypothetical protein F5884DRAFT_788661 [Xylogone sp. PMI_703]|nr:hypothetical protein F5884DRAFT_788661 [Xylogone sp. PMI_703]
MATLEAKTLDAKTEMAIADALDEIRTKNARLERIGASEPPSSVATQESTGSKTMEELGDEEIVKKAFQAKSDTHLEGVGNDHDTKGIPIPSFLRTVKKKKDHGAMLGIKNDLSLCEKRGHYRSLLQYTN